MANTIDATELVIRAKNLTDTEFAKAGANLQRFKKEAADAGASTSKVFGELNSALGTFGAALSIGGLVAFGKSLLDMGDQIQKAADRTGLATDEVQRLSFIAEQSGNSLDDLTGAMNKLQVRLASGEAAEGVKALGLNFKQLRDSSPYEQMAAVADAIGKIENPTLRAQRATEVFGKAGVSVLPTLIANFRELGDQAAVMSAETVQALDNAGDSISRVVDQLKIWAASGIDLFSHFGDGLVLALYPAIAKVEEGLASLLSALLKVPGAEKVFSGLRGTIEGLTQSAQWYRDAATAQELQLDRVAAAATRNHGAMAALPPIHEKVTRAVKEQKTALEQAADAWNAKMDAQAKAIGDMKLGALHFKVVWDSNFEDRTWATRTTLEATKAFVGVVSAIDVDQVRAAAAARIAKAFEDGPGFWTRALGSPQKFGNDLANAIMGAIQGGGSVVNAAAGMVGRELGTEISAGLSASLTKEGAGRLSKALGGMLESLLPGVGALLGPLMSKVWDGLKGLFGMGTAGRDLVKDFASTFGGFDDLHRQLGDLGAEGERLWVKLTQGVGRNNAQQARAAIDEVTKALAEHERKVREDAAAVETASKQIDASQQAALDAAKSRVQQLDDEIKSLQDSVANEAPEEEMGIVERVTREKIAALQEQREAAASALNDLTQQMTDSLDDVADAIRALPDEIALRLRVDTGGIGGALPDVLPKHEAGAYVREDHAAVVHAGEIVGPVDFMSRALGRALERAIGGASAGEQRIVLQVDGWRLAEVVLKNQGRILSAYGAGAR